MVILQRFVLSAGLSLAVAGCAVQYDGVSMTPGSNTPTINHVSSDLKKNIANLAFALKGLDPTIDPREADSMAYEAYVYPMYLANKWNLTWPPLYHNVLRNSKKREQGLCVDWAQAMRAHMRSKNYKTFDLWWAVAYKGNAWREHSTLAVTAVGKPLATGIILDPWRNSGELFWSRIPDDHDYPWKEFQNPSVVK